MPCAQSANNILELTLSAFISYSATMSIVETKESTGFMGLPMEIRDMILRHLLVIPYVAMEHRVDSDKVSLFAFYYQARTEMI